MFQAGKSIDTSKDTKGFEFKRIKGGFLQNKKPPFIDFRFYIIKHKM